MKKFYFTQTNISAVIKTMVSNMHLQGIHSIEIKTLSGDIQLPGGSYIGCKQATVLLVSQTISDFKLVIRRDDREGELHEYLLDYITIQWIKENKIPIHKKI